MRVSGWVGLAAAVVLCALGIPPVRATVYTSFDFETPSYGGFGRRMSDHVLLKQSGTWHLFYAELPTPTTPVSRIGHATSTDLAHWTEQPTVVAAGGGKAWMSNGVWAPHVLAAPGGGWTMLFTGKSATGSESMGALTSGDLNNWQLWPESPVFAPDTTWARWGDSFSCSCRDPFVYYANGEYNMLYTVMTKSPIRPAVGRATSLDLLHWNDAGPFAIDSVSAAPTDLESPSLVFDNGRVELHYTRYWAQMLIAPTVAGPWNFAQAITTDNAGAASEVVRDGTSLLFSRVRFDQCQSNTSVIAIDTVTANASGYAPLSLVPPFPAGWSSDGDAFFGQPVYGDGPKFRGSTPALPQAMRWIGTGESLRQPGGTACNVAEAPDRIGWLRSPSFLLRGDLVTFRLSGANLPDSTYAALVDDCTGEELSRRAGPGTSALTSFSWSNTGRRGWPVRFWLRDLALGPGGVIGLDAVQDTAVGNPTMPALPLVDVTAPTSGQNLTPGSSFTIRWTASASAGLDSFLVFVSYDDFVTPPTRIAKRNANQLTFSWTVPSGAKAGVKVRTVAYAKNGVHGCDDSGPFTIGIVTGVGDPPPSLESGLSLSARGSPGPAPVLEWRAPGGGGVDLSLYDVRGRRVRRLVRSDEGVVGSAVWDGRDEAGGRAPAGLYFAVLVRGDERRSLPIVRLAP